MDEVGAYLKSKHSKVKEPEKDNEKEIKGKVTKRDVENVVAKLARIPSIGLEANEEHTYKNLKNQLKLAIFGQDHAIETVVDAILLSKSGLTAGDKPIGSFLFAGPTGVGKTELAKKLAFEMGAHFFRLDMSEFMEKHAVSKLIGAPPGYVGHEDGGSLTDVVQKHPHLVLLLDEIEKAHPDIFNILLQVMDYGKLTDSKGRVSHFQQVILILTSNVGGRDQVQKGIGLESTHQHSLNVDDAVAANQHPTKVMTAQSKQAMHRSEKAIKETFSPEFRNRLTALIHFNPLENAQILKIVDKLIIELEGMLFKKKITLKISMEARQILANLGYSRELGARPLERLVAEMLKAPLSKEILFGKLIKGGEVFVSLNKKYSEIELQELKKMHPSDLLVFDIPQ